MTYRTPKQKISPLHPGRVRRKEQITKRCFLLLHKQSQTRSQEFDTRSQEQLANDFQDEILTLKDVSLNDDGSNDEDVSNNEDVSTDEDASTEGNVSTEEDFSTEEDVLTNGDDCDIQDSESDIADEPADFEPHNGSYGPYFGNFTQQMLFLWVTKHMICKPFLYRVLS